MKRKLFVGVLCVLIAAGAAAQELPFGAYIALFFDAEHVYNCREDGFGISTVYLFAIPIENGLECVSLQIQEYPPLLSIFDAVYSPELGIPIVGGIPGDLVACYSTCQNTDEWLLIAQFSVFVNSYSETFLGMLPFTGDDYPMMLDCNSSEKPCVIFCGAYFSSTCGYIWYQPPSSLISVKVDEPTVIRAAFDIQVLPGYAENTEHYYLREKESGTEVPITNAELSEDYYTVTLTLGSEMTPEIVHTLAALDVYNSLGGNSCIPDPTGGCMYPSTFDFTLIPIAVYLQGFDVACVPAGVELTWRLSRLEEDVHFSVLRRFAAGSAYVQLPNDDILRDDLTFTFVDDEVELGESYVYRVDYVLGEETGLLFETEAVQTPVLPLTLHQNVPNPFNPVTEISYYLPTAGDVLLEVYDVAGKRIATLVRGREEKGRHIVNWQGADDTGRAIASGIYFYRLRAGKEVISKKMVLLK